MLSLVCARNRRWCSAVTHCNFFPVTDGERLGRPAAPCGGRSNLPTAGARARCCRVWSPAGRSAARRAAARVPARAPAGAVAFNGPPADYFRQLGRALTLPLAPPRAARAKLENPEWLPIWDIEWGATTPDKLAGACEGKGKMFGMRPIGKVRASGQCNDPRAGAGLCMG